MTEITDELIELIIKEVSNKSDDNAEYIIDRLAAEHDFDYNEVEETEWTQDYKYQHNEVTFSIGSGDNIRYVQIDQSRSGSPFTDWYYQTGQAFEVEYGEVVTFSRHKKFVVANKSAKPTGESKYVLVKLTGTDAEKAAEFVTDTLSDTLDAAGLDVAVEFTVK